MLEFASVSASSYDPAALVAKLNEKAADGWSVVSIVGTGSDVTAFLSREAGSAPMATATTAAVVTTSGATLPVEEPAGWAVAPTAASSQSSPVTAQAAVTPQPAQQAQVAQTEQPSVPAMWAADPLNRYEMRYWDGTRWTEHVARAGQQYVDPLPQ